MSLHLTDIQKAEMRSFYEAELQKSLLQIRHLREVLDQLKDVDSVEISAGGVLPASGVKKKATAPAKPASTRKRRKKRGRKSIWGDYILKELKATDRPLLYSEIIESAKIRFNIPDSKMKELKAAINQSAFRLRTIHEKIDTIGAEGKKERYMALKAWYDEEGNIIKDYAAKVNL
ncbi:MAG: hypothetical protein KDC12_11525 [Flavobacteriales bacterium]|nr:hypothetical protein [Flavobacteriales bacterium]